MAAINNLSDVHPMKTNMDFCKAFSGDAARRPIFDLSDVTPDNDLQTRLKEFFIDTKASPLYSTLDAGRQPIDERTTLLIRDLDGFKNLYQVLEYSLMDEWAKFHQSPLCKSLFSSVGDHASAVSQGQVYNEKLIQNLKGILKPDKEYFSEGPGVQTVSKLQLNKFENWRTTRKANVDPNDYSLMSTGGVTTFFENVFAFKSPKPVRKMFEHPDAASQCKQIYGALGYQIVENDSPELGSNLDGLAKGRKPLYWESTTNGTMGPPVTCYICECYLYSTNTGLENNMECEHYFPFLEAQLFWGLHMPDNIKKASSGDRLTFLKREYGPVCRLCNGATHKTGLAMIKMNNAWNGGAGYLQKYKLNDFAIKRIARNTPHHGEPPALGREFKTNSNSHTFNLGQRLQRLNDVFTPLVDHINYELCNVSARRIVEILMLRYFYHLNDRTLKKIYGAYLNGEDISKKEKERKKFVKMIKKTYRRLRMVEHGVSKGFNKFTKFVLGKKREYDGIGENPTLVDRVRTIFRRSKRTQKLIEEKKAKADAELAHIKEQNIEIAKMMSETKDISDKFSDKYKAIIENPENNMFETPEEEEEYKFRLDSLCERNNAIVQYFMSNNIQKGGMIPISDPILYVDRKYKAYVIIEGFTKPVLALMDGYLKFLNACESYITNSLEFMTSVAPQDLFKNIYHYEDDMYYHQEKMDPDSFHDLSILDIFSNYWQQNPYAQNDVYSGLAAEGRAKFMEANNNLVLLLKGVDIACKPFQPPDNPNADISYSQNIDKYCNIKINELKDSIVRGKKFDLIVDYFADKRAHPEASSGGEAKDDSGGVAVQPLPEMIAEAEADPSGNEKVVQFTKALDLMITQQGKAVPSYLLNRWQVPLREDEENIEYLDTVRNYLDNIFEKDKISIEPDDPVEIRIADAEDDDDDEDDDGGGGGGASKKSVADEEYRKSRYEMITETEGEFKMFGEKYRKAFPHIKEKIDRDSFTNTKDIDKFTGVDSDNTKDDEELINTLIEEVRAHQQQVAPTAAAAAGAAGTAGNNQAVSEDQVMTDADDTNQSLAGAAGAAPAPGSTPFDNFNFVGNSAAATGAAATGPQPAAAPPRSPRKSVTRPARTSPSAGQRRAKRQSPTFQGGSRRKRKTKRKTRRRKNKKRKKKTRRKRKSN